MRRWLAQAGERLLDFVYPPHCVGCRRPGSLFCADCESQIIPVPSNICWRCGTRLSVRAHDVPGMSRLCHVCRAKPYPLTRVAATGMYCGPLRSAIHSFKYRNARNLAAPLATRLIAAWSEYHFSADLLVPVPLHPRRLAERGYNQSELLTNLLARSVSLPARSNLVVRQRQTQPQVELTLAARQLNVVDAFACTEQVDGLRIVVIDDVCTTGATLAACASALRGRGAARVWGLTLARAGIHLGADSDSD